MSVTTEAWERPGTAEHVLVKILRSLVRDGRCSPESATGLYRRTEGTAPLTDWQEFEARKQAWIAGHPDATPEEYDQAVQCLVDELGV
ncbi:MAG: hypothetical protein HQL52_19500 [Magnetococcales bacterium]|nr:hypothetical protein [Magnetococcales bacterium]